MLLASLLLCLSCLLHVLHADDAPLTFPPPPPTATDASTVAANATSTAANDDTTVISTAVSNVSGVNGTAITTATDDDDPNRMCAVCDCPDFGPQSSSPYEVMCAERNLSSVPPWPTRLLSGAGAQTPPGDLRLNLDRNALSSLPAFAALPSARLVSITARFNVIADVAPFAFADLADLELLSLAHNLLSAVHRGAFHGSPPHGALNLTELDLSHNLIRTLDGDAFDDLPGLRVLRLHHNPLAVLDSRTTAALNSLSRLDSLSLAYVEVDALPDELANPIARLTALDVAGNRFAEVPAVLRKGANLRELNLNNNPLAELRRGDLDGLSQLEKLNMSVMKSLVAVREGAWSSLVNLQILGCSYNDMLTSVSDDAFKDESGKQTGGEHLIELSLDHNNLTDLDETLLSSWVAVAQRTNLQGNPWLCDCNSRWIFQLNLNPELTEHLECSSPADVKGQPLKSVNESYFHRCLSTPHKHRSSSPSSSSSSSGSSLGVALILSAVVLVGVVATLIAVAYVVRRRRRLAVRGGSKARVHYIKARSNDNYDI